jgi:fructoselysine-6-P-deglycase FrlB-like protein
MQAHSELRNLSPVLREMVTKHRPEYERAIRGIHWGDAAIYVVSSARTLPAGLTAAYAFEDLLGCPVAVREFSSFLAHSLGAIRTGSVVILVSSEAPEVVDAARAATKRGAQVLAIAPASAPIAHARNRVFPLPEIAGASSSGLTDACLEHMAVGYLAVLAARLVKRPQPSLERLEKDWNAIPDHLDSLTSHLVDVVRASAGELRSAPSLFFVGDGYYQAAAERAARLVQRLPSCAALGCGLAHFRCYLLPNLGPGAGVVFLSGSQSRTRKVAAELAREAKERGAVALAVTGSNDHDLKGQARLTLLLPDLVDLPASILSLALAGWLGRELSTPPRHGRLPRSASVDSGVQGNLTKLDNKSTIIQR